MTNPTTTSNGPLEGIRVLDMATMLAGPYAATLLGDMGADVIKVESFFGDDSRHLGPERGGERTAFMSLNRNKRAVVIDMTRGEAARDVLGRLVASADVLITNIRAYQGLPTHRGTSGLDGIRTTTRKSRLRKSAPGS